MRGGWRLKRDVGSQEICGLGVAVWRNRRRRRR
jgi:hypothetical protein